ncbi:MAG: glycosyltransferase [Desulfobacterales bacterium]|nr:glycosyltransferase [Desulfobacterales bacterium]
MKILYLSTVDIKGGAALGAYRLHRGFLKKGIDSILLVNKKLSDDHTVKGPANNFQKMLNAIKPEIQKALLKCQKTPNTFLHSINLFPSGMARYINQSDVDFVILHWIGQEMLSIAEIGKIQKPVVWRLADQWAFSGSEHYVLPEEEIRYIEGYSRNNRPSDHKGLDVDCWTWQRKKKHWLHKPLTIVTGSRWLAECARKSYLFKDKVIKAIPSGLDMDIYKPVDKRTARSILNLPLDKKLILFGSMSAASDKRKGFHLLLPALQAFAENSGVHAAAIIFGASKPKNPVNFKMPAYYLSVLQDDWSLVLAYSAADVFILPTMQDNLPYTVMEAMACGTPSISFNIGGLPDMIEHEINGYLAEPFDPSDLANGLTYILNNDALRKKMSENCRQKALREYNVDVQVDRYLELFQSIEQNAK